jgi:hypothetical protein
MWRGLSAARKAAIGRGHLEADHPRAALAPGVIEGAESDDARRKHLPTGRSANLDALRLLLAAAVVVSHAWPLALGPGTAEPLAALTGHALGGWAVGLFFFLSGLW